VQGDEVFKRSAPAGLQVRAPVVHVIFPVLEHPDPPAIEDTIHLGVYVLNRRYKRS
jgi:hypothetical protein